MRPMLLRHRHSHGGGAMAWTWDRRARGEMGGARIGRTFEVCAPARRRCAVPCARVVATPPKRFEIRRARENSPRARKFAAARSDARRARRPRCRAAAPPPILPPPPPSSKPPAPRPPLEHPLGGASAPATELRPDRATAPSFFHLLAFKFQRKNSRWLLSASGGFRGRRCLFGWRALSRDFRVSGAAPL